MFLLTNLLLWGDIASNLLSEARNESGLNATQAQICLLLSGLQDGVPSTSSVLTPAEISRALCSPGARVHNQLSILVGERLIRRLKSSDVFDGRERPYQLTPIGLKRAAVYFEHLVAAERAFTRLVTKKDLEALDRLDRRLVKAIQVGAFNSKTKLERTTRDIGAPKRWNL